MFLLVIFWAGLIGTHQMLLSSGSFESVDGASESTGLLTSSVQDTAYGSVEPANRLLTVTLPTSIFSFVENRLFIGKNGSLLRQIKSIIQQYGGREFRTAHITRDGDQKIPVIAIFAQFGPDSSAQERHAISLVLDEVLSQYVSLQVCPPAHAINPTPRTYQFYVNFLGESLQFFDEPAFRQELAGVFSKSLQDSKLSLTPGKFGPLKLRFGHGSSDSLNFSHAYWARGISSKDLSPEEIKQARDALCNNLRHHFIPEFIWS